LKKQDLCMYVKWVYVNCQIRDNQSWLAYHTPWYRDCHEQNGSHI